MCMSALLNRKCLGLQSAAYIQYNYGSCTDTIVETEYEHTE